MSGLSYISVVHLLSNDQHTSTSWRGVFRRSAWTISAAACLLAFPALFATSHAYGQSPTMRLVQVDWPDPQKGKSNLEALLTKKHKPGTHIVAAELATVKIPVLVPEQLFDFDSLTVGAIGENQYYANAKSPGLIVLVNGSRIVHDIPGQSPLKNALAARNAHEYHVVPTETGFRLSLTSYGVPYSISTECKPTDKRCTEQYIRSLADRITFIGGEP